MRSSSAAAAALGLVAALLPASAMGRPNVQTQFITTNFTFPSADNATVDFSGPVTIAWDLPTDPRAREFSYKTLRLSLVFDWADGGTSSRPVVSDLDPHDSNYTWDEPAELFHFFHEDIERNYNTLADLPTGKRWWFALRFATENRSEVGVVTSSAFAIEGIEGYDGPSGDYDANGAGVLRPMIGAAALGMAAVGLWLL